MHFLVSGIFLLLICHLTFARAGSKTVSSSFGNMTVSLSPACNAICTNFNTLNDNCNLPHCACTTEYVEAQGNCLLCFSAAPEDEAFVQILLDAEVAQCRGEGLSGNFSLNLSSKAEALVRVFDRQSADLRRNQAVFLALQVVGGHIGLPAILIFFLYSHRVRRDPTFLNFCITWIFSSVAFSFLLYRGTKGNTIVNPLGEIEPNICLAQTALTEGAQLMTACSTLSLNIRLWFGLRTVLHEDQLCIPRRTDGNWINAGLLIVPYIFFVTFAVASVLVGPGELNSPGFGLSVQGAVPTHFYCAVTAPKVFIVISYGITLALVLLSIGFEAHVISILYRHWWLFWNTKTQSALSPSFLIRVMFFSTYQIVVAIADGAVIGTLPEIDRKLSSGLVPHMEAVYLLNGVPQWIDMLQAATPLVAVLVFGISNDMIMTVTSFVMFWRRDVSTNDQGLTVVSIDSDRYIITMPTEDESDAENINIAITMEKARKNGIHDHV